jgi:hypothetical protein
MAQCDWGGLIHPWRDWMDRHTAIMLMYSLHIAAFAWGVGGCVNLTHVWRTVQKSIQALAVLISWNWEQQWPQFSMVFLNYCPRTDWINTGSNSIDVVKQSSHVCSSSWFSSAAVYKLNPLSEYRLQLHWCDETGSSNSLMCHGLPQLLAVNRLYQYMHAPLVLIQSNWRYSEW